MKIGDAKPTPIPRPFFEDDRISLHAYVDGAQRFTKFSVTDKKNNEVTDFPIEGYKILAAWTKLENHVAKIVK